MQACLSIDEVFCYATGRVEPALAAVVGADAVRTGDAQLDAYTADTYWPAIAARARHAARAPGRRGRAA